MRVPGEGEVVLPAPEGPAAAAIRRFDTLLRGAGLSVRTAVDFPREVWRKVLVNAAINPVTALHDIPNGRLLEEPYRREAVRLLREAAAVARALGVAISAAEAEADLERVVRATADNRSSMLQDIDRHRPTEVDAISGALLRLGRERHLAMPGTEEAVAQLRTRAAEVWSPKPEPS
ncbi:2-dehydropantoate 2-reductase [mine drainage metagenome]|uniref:2-dehydropantoate 2-reductase n=1 Tax=mine drainage metagenome TaxID=410659 RepID=T1BVB6_9ZZZZ